MPIYIISTVSGGYFIRQLAAIEHIRSMGLSIDGYFGNSGGAIANLLSIKYNNSTESILRILNSLRSNMFANPWVRARGLQMFSPWISILSDSLYDGSKGIKEILKMFYTPAELRGVEMWVGRYDACANINYVMSTKAEGTSNFTTLTDANNTRYFEDMTGTYDIEYANGNFDVVSKYIEATSNIPGVKPPTEGKYIDGGVGSASLASIFVNVFKDNYDNEVPQGVDGGTRKTNVVMFYNQGRHYIDEDIETFSSDRHWIVQMSKMGQWLINFRILTEKQLLFEAWLGMIGKKFNEVTFTAMTEPQFRTFISDGTERHIFATTYSENGEKINIVNFNYRDLEKSYKDSLKSTKFDVYHCINPVVPVPT